MSNSSPSNLRQKSLRTDTIFFFFFYAPPNNKPCVQVTAQTPNDLTPWCQAIIQVCSRALGSESGSQSGVRVNVG